MDSAVGAARHQRACVAVIRSFKIESGSAMIKPHHAIYAAFVATLLMAATAHSQPALPTDAGADAKSTSGMIPWSAIIDSAPAGNAGFNDKPLDAGAGTGAGIANTVKEAVRPVHDGLVHSAVVQTLREFDADSGGGPKRQDNADRNTSSNPSGSGKPAAPARSAQQIQRDQSAASAMLDELVKEVTPWAIGVMGLIGLGFLGKLWLDYMHAKAARPGKMRRAARRKSRMEAVHAAGLDGTQIADAGLSDHSEHGSRSGRSGRSGGGGGGGGGSGSGGGGSGRIKGTFADPSSSPSPSGPMSGPLSGRRRPRSHRSSP